MDEKIDKILRSKYMSLFCALINGFFAINCLIYGRIFWFFLCGLFCAICFRSYVRA
jgi:hypothetical protein